MTKRDRELLEAARAWRASLIPGTSTAGHDSVVRLLAAIGHYDDD